ncbi:MAG: glycosyl transferase family 2 [Gallionellales bacterium RIFCSPLOWO2_12_FULL_59_22]|nr:MAG: glycosyl transferase family 2 [Gallionellales bacterium RIFCSPLOWO2_02_FULL_59_110]OGT14328.1 MAG: glycosyl transferase family 2 [Gallionellales bacterium RIFCSPLOWO2_12_FULL_59_22]
MADRTAGETAKLSVILIAKNEAANLRACLEAVAWADEIVVVDSGSTDGTLDIAREFTGKVYVHAEWPGFGKQKNRALDYASGDWVLSLDADERVTPELRAEIEAVLASPQASGYEIPRLSSFCGRFMRHSGWYPDYVLRLFRRGSGRFDDAPVHEAVRLEGKAARLKTPLLHYSYRDFDDVLDKLNRYSSAAAAVQEQRGKRGGLATAVGHGLWSFIRTYFLRAGFLDGREGFMLAVLNAEHSYYRYLKLMLLHDRSGAKR